MNEFKAIIVVLFVLVLLSQPFLGMETKTAYTRDGINFVSKARMEENIKYEYAEPGDYKEVQVPMDTIVVGASEYLEDTSNQRIQRSSTQTISNQITTNIISENILIILIGFLFCSAFIFMRIKRKNNLHIGEPNGASFNLIEADIAQKPKIAPRDSPSKYTNYSAEDAQIFIDDEACNLMDKASDLSLAGKYEEAIGYLDKAILLRPNWESIWAQKGRVFEKWGNYDEALKNYDETLRLDPENFVFWVDKASALKQLGHIAKSSYCSGIAYQIDGHYSSNRQMMELAEKAFRKAKELGLSDKEARELDECLEKSPELARLPRLPNSGL